MSCWEHWCAIGRATSRWSVGCGASSMNAAGKRLNCRDPAVCSEHVIMPRAWDTELAQLNYRETAAAQARTLRGHKNVRADHPAAAAREICDRQRLPARAAAPGRGVFPNHRPPATHCWQMYLKTAILLAGFAVLYT